MYKQHRETLCALYPVSPQWLYLAELQYTITNQDIDIGMVKLQNTSTTKGPTSSSLEPSATTHLISISMILSLEEVYTSGIIQYVTL